MPFQIEWEVQAHQGAGQVGFGATYDDVVGLLGMPDQPLAKLWRSNAQRAGWQGGGLVVHFDPVVTFIEFSRGAWLIARLLGIDVFQTPAAEVVRAIVSAGHAFDDTDPEVGHAFVFKDLQVGLWRQVLPKDGGDRDGMYFDTVSVGVAGYYG